MYFNYKQLIIISWHDAQKLEWWSQKRWVLLGNETKIDYAGKIHQQFTWPDLTKVSQLQVGTRSWWLVVSMEVEESPRLEVAT
jgi:hypothetical protein